MHNRERIISKDVLGDGEKGTEILEVKLFYDEGGMNYFAGTATRRGYYVSARTLHETAKMRSFFMFDGIKGLVQEATRFNQKTLDSIVPPAELVEKLKKHVLDEREKKREKAVPHA